MAENNTESGTVDTHVMWLMIFVAAFFDFFQFILDFIPFLGWALAALIGIFGEMTFLFWFKMQGISYKKNPKSFLATWIIVPLIEFIPVLNALPSFTVGVAITLFKAKAEEKLKNASPLGR